MKEDISWFLQMNEQTQLQSVVATNEYTERFGLTLSQEDASLLIKERSESLKRFERIEFGEGILPKLIFTFCDSSFIEQDSYVETISRLQEIFYLYKNESLDELTDDELIEFMKEAFEGVCQGSLDYLEDTVLERFASEIRSKSHAFIGRYKHE